MSANYQVTLDRSEFEIRLTVERLRIENKMLKAPRDEGKCRLNVSTTLRHKYHSGQNKPMGKYNNLFTGSLSGCCVGSWESVFRSLRFRGMLEKLLTESLLGQDPDVEDGRWYRENP